MFTLFKPFVAFPMCTLQYLWLVHVKVEHDWNMTMICTLWLGSLKDLLATLLTSVLYQSWSDKQVCVNNFLNARLNHQSISTIIPQQRQKIQRYTLINHSLMVKCILMIGRHSSMQFCWLFNYFCILKIAATIRSDWGKDIK